MSCRERDEKRKYQENGKRKEREKENIFLYVFLNVGKKKKKEETNFFPSLVFKENGKRNNCFLFYTLEDDL